ncbi:MAG: hypothetical protein CMO80_01110 [Verrucomicrobiales bacterium]|nr:hypothetical protein [Verrucomicrobiales bacterium]
MRGVYDSNAPRQPSIRTPHWTSGRSAGVSESSGALPVRAAVFSTNLASFLVDVAGYVDVELSFDWRSLNDEVHDYSPGVPAFDGIS